MIEEYRISFKGTDKSVLIKGSKTILDAAWACNVYIDAPCAGAGRCYKCKFRLIEGSVDAAVFVEPDIYLACKAKPLSDCVVEVEQTAKELKSAETFEDIYLLSGLSVFPAVKKQLISVDPEMDLVGAIKAQLSGLKFISSDIPKAFDDLVTLTIRDDKEIIDIESADTRNHNYGLAIDLGTTTIDAFLVDLNNSNILAQMSIYNAQRSFGEDVISRIVYCEKNKDTSQVYRAAIETINQIIESFKSQFNINNRHIYSVVISGNTTMSYLVTNQDPAQVRKSDEVEEFKQLESFEVGQVGLKVNTNTNVLLLPSIASFVGGDITSGILSSQLYKADCLTLLVDIGTNGELVLGNNEWMLSCSCSAGPAFEGSSVSCGTRFMPGAINEVSIDPETFEAQYKTNKEQPPLGICGTALIDLVAQMLGANIIDRQGKINRGLVSQRIRQKGNIYEYVVVFSDNDTVKTDISIDENDIQNLIRAKAAIFAGILMLLKSVDLSLADLEKVIVAGTFGKHINFKNAITIGLLPDIDISKFDFLGNTSLFGAYQLIKNAKLCKVINSIVQDVTYIDLSTNAEYMDLYTAGLFLPHTDLSLFGQK